MAFSTRQVASQAPLLNCGGKYRMGTRGVGIISGITKINLVASPCRVFLHDADGTLRGFRRTGPDGAYTFRGLAGGDYRLVIEDDRRGLRRPKVELVVVA